MEVQQKNRVEMPCTQGGKVKSVWVEPIKESDTEEVRRLKKALMIETRTLSFYETEVEQTFGSEYSVPDSYESRQRAKKEVEEEIEKETESE